MREFLLSIFRLLIGDAWNRIPKLLVIAGILAIVGVGQYIVVGLFALAGVRVNIPDVPIWAGFLLIGIAAAILVLGRLLPAGTQVAPPHPHDVHLLRSYRNLVTPQLIAFLT